MNTQSGQAAQRRFHTTFDEWSFHMRDAASAVKHTHGQRYRGVYALMISWGESDLHILPDINALAEMLVREYYVEVYPLVIPSSGDPTAFLRDAFAWLSDFFAHRDILMIVHYMGHGGLVDNSADGTNLHWYGTRRDDGPKVDAYNVSELLRNSPADLLIILDCCSAAGGATGISFELPTIPSSETGRTELLAACSPIDRTCVSDIFGDSFTRRLTAALKPADGVDPITTTSMLLVTRMTNELQNIFDRVGHVGGWVPPIPQILCVTKGSGREITLRPHRSTGTLLQFPRIRSTDDGPLGPMSNDWKRVPRGDGFGEDLGKSLPYYVYIYMPANRLSQPRIKNTRPWESAASPAGHGEEEALKYAFDMVKEGIEADVRPRVPTVLVAFSLADPATDPGQDKHTAFQEKLGELKNWLTGAPTALSALEIECFYESDSILLIMRLPTELWSFLPPSPDYKCLGVVRGDNIERKVWCEKLNEEKDIHLGEGKDAEDKNSERKGSRKLMRLLRGKSGELGGSGQRGEKEARKAQGKPGPEGEPGLRGKPRPRGEPRPMNMVMGERKRR